MLFGVSVDVDATDAIYATCDEEMPDGVDFRQGNNFFYFAFFLLALHMKTTAGNKK